MTFMKSLFRTINKMYRECIDKAQSKYFAEPGDEEALEDDRRTKIKYPAITLAQLKESIPEGETIITELDMVSEVFSVIREEIKYAVSKQPIPNAETGPMPEFHHLLTVVLCYCESLLAHFIYPHKRLQVFLFDLCVESRNFPTLQQLLSFHVILDSSDIVEKLSTIIHLPWAAQCQLDAAKRASNTKIVIERLLTLNRPEEIVPYLRKNDPNFDLEALFGLTTVTPPVRKQLWRQIELWNVSSAKVKPTLTREIIMAQDSP